MPEVTVVREIDPSARIAPDAAIGPYCVIGPSVTIGPGTVLLRRVSVTGHTTIGSGNFIDEGCVLGSTPQDLKYAGAATLLVIGHRNRFGQRVTAHVGTESGGFLTRIGNDNVFRDSCHIAHDCYVDDRTFLGKDVLLAGHIAVQTGAVIDDNAGVHHFVTIGRYGRVGHHTPVRRDVPPFTVFFGTEFNSDPPAVTGIHETGVRAAKLSAEEEKELRKALRELFTDEAALQTKIEQLVNLGVEGEVAELCAFCQRSLQGLYGRHREIFRGVLPPEAEKYLPPELRAEARRRMS
jgi:UDP-N-acetylglucosamine acyltransferase